MGKNQAYKAMQRAKMASTGAPDEIEDGMMDGSFHSPEWHAARLASLQTSHTVTWDEFSRRQKEAERKKNELEADELRMMKDYRAQLDAERASKLARGRNHADKRAASDKVFGMKEKDRKGSRKNKSSGKRHRDETSSDSDSYSSSSDDERDTRKKERSKSKRSRKDKKKKSRRKRSKRCSDDSSGDNEEPGPVALSSFFGKQKI